MKTSAYLFFFGGLLLFTILIGRHGLTEILTALSVSGWGLIWVTLFHAVPLGVNAVAWQRLFQGSDRPPLPLLIWTRWIGESINQLLPVAQVGGALAKARLTAQRGVPGPVSGASVMVDLTVGVVAQIVFTLVGVCLLLLVGDREVAATVLIVLTLMTLLVAIFFLVQRHGIFVRMAGFLTRFSGGRNWQSLIGDATALDEAVSAMYRNRRGLLNAGIWRLCGWITGAGEVWLALYFLGAPVGLKEALLLESLGRAVRAAAFLIPGGLGVQEGGFLVLGGLVGLRPEMSLALSLTKRVRELLLGLPGLVVWQVAEGQRFWHRFHRIFRRSGK